MLNIEAAAPKSTSPVTVPAAALQKPPAPNPVVRSKPVSTPVEKKPRVSGGIAHPTNMALAGTTDSPATLPARTSGLQVPSHDPSTPLPLEEVRRDLQYSDRKRKPDALDETGGGGAGSLDSNGSTLPRYNTAQTYGRLPTTSDMTLTMPPPPPKVPSSNVSSAPVVAVDTPVLFTRESMDTLRETKIPAANLHDMLSRRTWLQHLFGAELAREERVAAGQPSRYEAAVGILQYAPAAEAATRRRQVLSKFEEERADLLACERLIIAATAAGRPGP